MSNPPGYNNQPGYGHDPYGGNQPYGQPSASGAGSQSGNFDDATVLAPGASGQQPPYGQPSASQPYGQPSQPTYGQSATPPPAYGASQPSAATSYNQPQQNFGQPNQPYAQPGYGANAPQYGQPAPAGSYPPPPPAKKKKSALPWIIAGAVLLLVVGLVVAMVLIPMNSDSPDKAMKGYMQALADGDSKKALSYLDTDPQDKTFLNDAVLKELKTANKGVSKVGTSGKTYVNATIGGEDKMVSLAPHKVGGKYKVSGLATLKGKTGIALKTAGVTLKQGEFNYPVFPGIYDLKSDNAYYDLGTGSSIDASSVSYSSTYFENIKLTTAGNQAARDAAKKALNDCLAQKKLAPAGCPWKFNQPNDGTADESTVKTTLQGSNPYDTATFSFRNGKASYMATFSIVLAVDGKDKDGKSAHWESYPKSVFTTTDVDLEQNPAKATFN